MFVYRIVCKCYKVKFFWSMEGGFNSKVLIYKQVLIQYFFLIFDTRMHFCSYLSDIVVNFKETEFNRLYICSIVTI